MEFNDEDINSLQCVITDREKRQLAAQGYPYEDVMPLNLHYKRKLRILIAAYNSFCRQYSRNMKPYNITKAAIDEFRVTDYRIGSPLVHWTSLGSDEARERESWSKSIKRNKKDYTIFKHEASFRHWYEETVDTAQAHGVYDLLEPTKDDLQDQKANPALTRDRSQWFYQCLLYMAGTSTMKAILKAERGTKDIAKIWKLICEEYGDSVTTSMTALEQKRFLVTNNFSTTRWKGTSVSMIDYFMEIFRRYNVTNPGNEISDEDMIEYLRMAAIGHKKFEPVWTTYEIQRKTDGSKTPIRLSTYVALLKTAAQQLDASNDNRGGGRRYQANLRCPLAPYVQCRLILPSPSYSSCLAPPLQIPPLPSWSRNCPNLSLLVILVS